MSSSQNNGSENNGSESNSPENNGSESNSSQNFNAEGGSGNGRSGNRRTRILTSLLVVSLAINLLIVGGLIGFRLQDQGPGRPMPSHLRWLVHNLDDDAKRQILPLMKTYAEESAPLRRKLRNAREAFIDSMTQEPLNDTKIETAISELQQTTTELQTNMHRQMIDIMKQLDPSDRQRALKFLQRRGSHDRRRTHMARDKGS